MAYHARCSWLFIALATVAAGSAFSQVKSDPTVSIKSSATAAYVYVQTSKGINLYDSSSAGKLSLVKGSPFPFSGPGQTLVGSNGKYLVTLGMEDLHSYPIASNGVIGKQLDQINTQSYGGSECVVPTVAAEPDHSGNYFFVLLTDRGSADCNALQTFGLSKDGELEFKGDLTVGTGFNGWIGLPFITGNDMFGFGVFYNGYDESSCFNELNTAYKAGSQEVLQQNSAGKISTPAPPPSYDAWQLLPPPDLATVPSAATDASDHVVLQLTPFTSTDGDCYDGGPVYGPSQIAAFTVSSKGQLTTTNTYKNMPTLQAGVMSISPSGKVLAVATGTGTQFFHFNGASPIIHFTGIIGSSGYITKMQWDKSDHLYVINGASGKVHVYTVTTSSVVEAAGSPYNVGATALAVVMP